MIGPNGNAVIGIDVSKDNLSCTLLDPKTRTALWQETFDNTQDGIGQLLRKTPAQTPWVLEPTGKYGLPVVKQAHQHGLTALMAAPRQAKAFLQSLSSRAKTDRIDSYGLALFALSRPLPFYPIKSAAVEQLDQLLSARKGLSKAITRLHLQTKDLPYAAEPLTEAITALKSQLKAIDKQIAQITKADPQFALAKELEKIPGVGKVTAAAVASRLRAKSFSHPDQFVAYVGLDIGVSQSGKRSGHRGLTKQGDAELRRLLYLCAQANLRTKSSVFKDQYEREKAKGLTTTGALCAVARKLAMVCWSLHKHGGRFDPARVYSQPTAKACVNQKDDKVC